ncbi:MAG: IclR family transcriptional regulator C-terminal domain-containing protein [Rhizobiaceae bacterium]
MPGKFEESSRPPEFVEALAKGLLILESFDSEHPEMTLSDVARRVGLSPAAARRSLITLQTMGYVGQTNKRFHLRPKVMSLGSAFYFSARVDEVLQPELRHLVGRFGDASSVATLEGHDVLYVAHYSEQRARRPTAVLGARYPAHATSLGRVLLAGLPDVDFDRYLREVEPVALTKKTVTEKAQIKAIVEEVRDKNYSTTVDQLDYGITALAVPIRGASGRTIAALNSSGYSGLLTVEELVANRLQELRLSAGRLSQTLSRFPVLESIIGTR